jgi:hypothetical protein
MRRMPAVASQRWAHALPATERGHRADYRADYRADPADQARGDCEHQSELVRRDSTGKAAPFTSPMPAPAATPAAEPRQVPTIGNVAVPMTRPVTPRASAPVKTARLMISGGVPRGSVIPILP